MRRILSAGALSLAVSYLFFAFAVPARGQGFIIPPADALSNGVPVSNMKSLDQVEPRKMIDRLPFVVGQPGSYYVTSNLVGVANAHGIDVICGDVKIDLGGFALNGVSNSWNGINVASNMISNVVIRNGVVRNWGLGLAGATTGFGVMATNVPDMVLADVRAFGNVCGGLYVGDNAKVEGCAAYGNGYGASGLPTPIDSGIQCGFYGTISDCKARGNRGSGIFVGPHSRITGCTAAENSADGIKGDNFCTIRDCLANLNLKQGITAFSMCRVVDNTCCQNGYGMTGAVLWAGAPGINVFGSNNVVEKNILARNSGAGVVATNGLKNLIINNCASGNLGPDFNIIAGSFRGIVVQPGSGDITNSNPWANFSFN